MFLAVGAASSGVARAQKKALSEIEEAYTMAVENFDLLEFEEARKGLNRALTIAKRNDLETHPALAKVHVFLGVVYFAGLDDAESAKLSFINAVEIDGSVQIDPAYKTGDMEALLEEARKQFGGGGGGGGRGSSGSDDIDCASLTGIQHTLVDEATAGSDREIVAYVAGDLGAAKVSLHYRPQGAADFAEVKMSQSSGCKFAGQIPGKSIGGEFLHYYVAAYNKKGKAIASKGSSGSPNIIEVAAAAGGVGDDENPLGDNENPLGNGNGNGGEIGGSVTTTPKTPKVFISVALGTGGGFVTGETETPGFVSDVGCCFAPALFHLFPEIGYYLTRQMSISAAFRMGFPIGADTEGHATAAPSGMVRFRYALGDDGDGFILSAALGGGVIRHTVEIPDQMVTDTVASGPLLIGGGAGYQMSVGGPIKFVAELNTIAGIPIIDELGTCPGSGCVRPNFALQFDVNLGLIFAF